MPPFTAHEIPTDIAILDGCSAPSASSLDSPVARVGQRIAAAILLQPYSASGESATHLLDTPSGRGRDGSTIHTTTIHATSFSPKAVDAVAAASLLAGPNSDTVLAMDEGPSSELDQMAMQAMVRAVDYVIVALHTDADVYTLKTDGGIPPIKMVLAWTGAASIGLWRRHGLGGFFAPTSQAAGEITALLPPSLFFIHPAIFRYRCEQ
ncbi:hypothetical protein M427DRAFT_39973, partial [Gonapodya prolifera JEL478]